MVLAAPLAAAIEKWPLVEKAQSLRMWKCDQLKVFGSSELKGSIKFNKFRVLGETSVKENLHGEGLRVIGTLSAGGNAYVHQTKVRGTIDIGSGFKGEQADIKGMITTGGNLEAETLSLQGGFEVGGVLNAGTMDIGLRFSVNKAEEIVGGKIIIKKNSSIPFFSFGKGGRLEAKTIEGDDIYLENTKADVVRGHHVKIGPGCEIGIVEYSGTYEYKSESVVKENRQI